MKIIGHRGAPLYAPENTLKSFALAQSAGLDMLETDVHLTADNKLVINHDENLKRTCGVDVEIKTALSKDIFKYGAPELKQLLAAMRPRMTLDIEIKTDVVDYPGIEKLTLKEVYDAGMRDRVIISSFNVKTLLSVRALDDKIRIGYLARKFDAAEAKKIKPAALIMNWKRFTPEIIRTAKDMGLKVWAYTVNDFQIYEQLEKAGVDAVFSDNPYMGQRNALGLGGVI